GEDADELRALRRDIGDLEIQWREEHRKAIEEKKEAWGDYPLPEIQRALDKEETLLFYSLAEPRSYVWVVRRDHFSGYRLKSREDLEPVIERYMSLFDELSPLP